MRSTLSAASKLNEYIQDGDFLDCFGVKKIPQDKPLHEIAQYLFIEMPAWFNALLALRDLGAAPFGLKTTKDIPLDLSYRDKIEVGDYINFFQVLSISPAEIILGEDDKHLDFKISIFRDISQSNQVSVATLVQTHNLLGRAYLRSIKPFHDLIVQSRLKDAERHFAFEL